LVFEEWARKEQRSVLRLLKNHYIGSNIEMPLI